MDKFSRSVVGFRPKKLAFIFLAAAVLILFSFPKITYGAALTALSDTSSRLKKSTASDHTIKFTTATGVDSSSDTITVTLPSGFTIGSVDYSDIDLSHGASTGYETEENLAAAAGSGVWGAVFSGQVLTLTAPTNASSGEITASDKVIIEIGNNASGGNAQITNHATAATYTISLAGTFGDTGKIAIVILDDDQVQLTANVNPSITFTISVNVSAMGDLSVGSVITASPNITLTVGTNSQSGYNITVQDQGSGSNPGLYNSSASYLIGSADGSYADTAALSAGTEGFGIQASSAGATVAARYNQTGNTVGGLEITPTTLASYSSGMTSNHTIDVVHKAAISSWTRAGSYSDILTYIATGNF